MISSSSMTRIEPRASHGDLPSRSVPRRERRARPARSGNDSTNRVPWPTWLSQSIDPSCSRTMP